MHRIPSVLAQLPMSIFLFSLSPQLTYRFSTLKSLEKPGPEDTKHKQTTFWKQRKELWMGIAFQLTPQWLHPLLHQDVADLCSTLALAWGKHLSCLSSVLTTRSWSLVRRSFSLPYACETVLHKHPPPAGLKRMLSDELLQTWAIVILSLTHVHHNIFSLLKKFLWLVHLAPKGGSHLWIQRCTFLNPWLTYLSLWEVHKVKYLIVS